MRVAVYPSVLYGEDFLRESIASVRPHVDAVYLVLMRRPWGHTEGVIYKGAWVPWPAKFDRTREIAEEIQRTDPGIHILDDDTFSPWNRWGHAVNDVVRKACEPREVVILDPDCVFHEQEAVGAFADWDAHPEYIWGQPEQVELWRTPAWQVVRPRCMVTFARGDLGLLSDDVRKKRGVQAPATCPLAGIVHNLGFCVSERTMRWKHLTSMAFSPVIGESLPNPDWYEEKWLRWTPGTRNLEVSIGSEGSIPCAVPYDVAGLPGSIRRRYGI